MSKRPLLFFLCSLAYVPMTWAGPSLVEIWDNNQGAEMMAQKKMTEAHETFSEALAKDPFSPILQYNLGASFIGIEEYEKAAKMYKEILKQEPLPPEVGLASSFNLGALYHQALKDTDQALKYYQKALEYDPESEMVKTNIELLMMAQGGGGKGDSDKKDKPQEGEDGEQPKEPQQFTNKPQPNQYDGKDMSKQDVKKILEELKKQEQRIRAKHDRKGDKEADRDKNW